MNRTIATAAIALALSSYSSAYCGEIPTPDLKNPKMISAGLDLFRPNTARIATVRMATGVST
jgi:hypothetical protein